MISLKLMQRYSERLEKMHFYKKKIQLFQPWNEFKIVIYIQLQFLIYFAIKLLHIIHSSKHQNTGTIIPQMSSKFVIIMSTWVCEIFIPNTW